MVGKDLFLVNLLVNLLFIQRYCNEIDLLDFINIFLSDILHLPAIGKN